MSKRKTYISKLTPELNPCTINVKVLRTWCYRATSMPITHRHFEMIVLDENGDKIYVIVNNGRFAFLDKYFKEYMVILMSNFNVIPNNTSYKYTEHPYKISFDGFATARRSNAFDGNVNKLGFEVTEYSDIMSLNLNTELPVDIEGEVFSWEYKLTDYEVCGCKTKVLPLKLKDTLGIELTCLVMGIMAEKLPDYIKAIENYDKFLMKIGNARVYVEGKAKFMMTMPD
ncbi:replication protein A 70 kDa DNA-binding subunit D [Artemisia annua]|uniref:Replication protein A 70 kDa DNA-binding subunit D n=1 Tax=Artemisia annua TaxID=35608 RepID=A0A2U1L2A8_ARTAN|nr:replication protein A 70 kDa DNA-binding subunit D [Artemisia annua]